MRPLLRRRPVFPEIFPAITQNITTQGNNAVCAFDRPVHTGLFQTLVIYPVLSLGKEPVVCMVK
jgi:hypothetical protein